MPDPTPPIGGTVAAGFEPVAEAFRRNFADRQELGAACAVFRHGRAVVDLWGGWRDRARTQPWQRDTMVCVFSLTKGVAATTLAMAHAHGRLDYDAPVRAYWPEFAQAGKERITVRQLLSHQAGLSVIDERLTLALLADSERLDAVLARQAPAWQPGAHHGYHFVSLGWYENALLRRVDPRRRSTGQFLRDEIATPHGIDFHIGLPEDVPGSRLAELRDFRMFQILFHPDTVPLGLLAALLNPWSLSSRSLNNPRFSRPRDFASPGWRRVEMPAANGIGTARAAAQLYGLLAVGGAELGLNRQTLDLLEARAVVPARGRFDLVLRSEANYSLGFAKPFDDHRFGRDGRSFGFPGMGGSFAFADPAEGLGFAYAPNRSGFYLRDDPREVSLRRAVYQCLDAMGRHEISAADADGTR